jgi:chemotaxis protein methyltransferase CheR
MFERAAANQRRDGGNPPSVTGFASRLDQKTFDGFKRLILEKSGICLGPQKESLVCARVGKRMRQLGMDRFEEYLAHVEGDDSGQELVQLLDVISTNVTSFFRESIHFDLLAQYLRAWSDQGQRRFRIWSAASSTGEEPYTIAMTLLETLGQVRGLDARILATDISTRVLEACKRGAYAAEKVEAVPAALRARYFHRERNDPNNIHFVGDELKRLIAFSRLNLSAPPFPMKGPMDVVFCRNVMIYFDNQVRTALLKEVHRLLRPGGYLFIGHAETLAGLPVDFRSIRPAVYQKT